MIRVTNERVFTEEGLRYVEMAGLSGDTKPLTGMVTGSMFLEVDTGKAYAFDEETDGGKWWELGATPEEPAADADDT